ncbi:MAG: MFS transporter [Chlamydiae bacterium]|nr:MFS transporter [Chlamydiota bacterium]
MQATAQKVRQAFLLTKLFSAPFWTLYAMLAFILYKDLHATPFQISLFISLKPVVSLLSIYWSGFVHHRPDRLKSNIIWATIIGHLPFLFVPFMKNPWLFIAASGFYMMLMRGIIPAWMEVLKLHLPSVERENAFAMGSILSYLTGILLPIFLGRWLDSSQELWRLLFPMAATLSLIGMLFQLRIPKEKIVFSSTPSSIFFLQPWKDAWNLLKTKKDFFHFQIGFMLGGSALMILQPALPIYFNDFLHISYSELAIALSLCKGIGYALTSRIWAKTIHRYSIYLIGAFVTLAAAIFPLLLLSAQSTLVTLYAAYFVYGLMQAGSELTWHLSGPIFSQKENSSIYSSVNVITVGVRGIFAPFLGALLFSYAGIGATFIIGSILCLIASLKLRSSHRQFQPISSF